MPKIICDDNKLSFNDLLEKDGSASIHEQNFQDLATKCIEWSITPSHERYISNKQKSLHSKTKLSVF